MYTSVTTIAIGNCIVQVCPSPIISGWSPSDGDQSGANVGINITRSSGHDYGIEGSRLTCTSSLLTIDNIVSCIIISFAVHSDIKCCKWAYPYQMN